MLGFKQFLDEVWSRGSEDRDTFNHHDYVAGHKVKVSFEKTRDGRLHDIGYRVDGSYNKAGKWGVPPNHEATKKIFKHIHGKIHQFMRHRKPHRVRLQAWDGDMHGPKRTELNRALAHHLAKKFGGSVRETLSGRMFKTHEVEKD